MIRRWRLAQILPLFLTVLAGCESVVEPTPDRSFAPEVARQILETDDADHRTTVSDDEGNEYTLIEALIPPIIPELHVSRIIDASGGTLSLAGHKLTVPANAVKVPTVFLMVVLPNGRVEVELQALVSTLFGVVSVGEEGFAEPVTLSLTYAWAANVESPDRLKILHLREDGTADPLPSTVNPTTRTVTAKLGHFSRYCMASN